MLTLDKVLEEIADHPIEEQKYIEEILHKRIIDETRLDLKKTSEEIREEIKQGKFTTGNLKELRNYLDA